MHGSVKTPTFVRLATEPHAGNTTLTLSAPVSGWKIGDRLVLPDTRHIKESEVTGGGWVNAVNQWEERTVLAVSQRHDPHAQQRPAVRPPGRPRFERCAGFPAARREPDEERHGPIGESLRHPRAHAGHPPGRRGHPLRPVQGHGAHDVFCRWTTRPTTSAATRSTCIT